MIYVPHIMSIEARLQSLGLVLPTVPAAAGAYLQCVQSGNLLFLAGGLPFDQSRKITGQVPTDVSIEEAIEGARIIVLNRLAVIKETIGSLDKIVRFVTLNGFVNSASNFYDHPTILNGASELIVEIFGDRGHHSRTAIGVAALPLNAAVEINMIVEVE